MKVPLIAYMILVLGRYLSTKKTSSIKKWSDKKEAHYSHPLVQEFLLSKELDEKTRKELLRPITHKNFHNPNIPLFEPYKLSERQQDVLLSHD
jgi:hypothetical protein